METITKLMKNNLFTWLQINLAGGAKSLLMVAALLCGVNNVWGGYSVDYYGKATVSPSPTAGGKVYISANNTVPSDSQYSSADVSATAKKHEGSESGSAPSSLDVTLYAWAKANEGYSFYGWSKEKGGKDKGTNLSLTITESAFSEKEDNPTNLGTWYANFTANTYTVVFNGNGASGGNTASQQFQYDETKALTANGFEKKCTVSFDANGGSVVSAIPSNAPFNGWATSASGEKAYNDKQPVSNLSSTQGATVNLYATWGAYEEITLPSSTKSGAVLDGWYSGDTKIGNPGATYTPTADITLKAKWQEKYTPEISYKGSASYNVGDGPIDLQQLWTSTGNGAITYTKVIFNPASGEQTGSTEPAITSNRYLSLNKAGTLKIHLEQAGTSTYYPASADVEITISRIANTLTVDATRSMFVDDVWTSVISGKNSDGTITTTSSDATIAYYDVTNDKVWAPNSQAKSFASTNITLHIIQAETYKYTAVDKTITVTVNKHDNTITASYAGSMYMGATQNVTISSNNTNTPIVTTQTAGENIATLNDAKTQVTSYAYLGTATWTLSQAETYKYKAANNVTMSINVVQMNPDNCDMATSSETYSANLGNTTKEFTWTEQNAANELYFKATVSGASMGNAIQVQQKVNGSWSDVGSKINGRDNYPDGSKPVVTLSQSAMGVRFYIEGSLTTNITGVRVTRNKHITPTSTITIDKKSSGEPIYVGEEATGTLHVDWSFCNGGELKLKSTNPKFTLSQYSITEATDGTSGSKDITVSYHSATADTVEGKIVIYNDVYRKETAIIGITQKKTPSMSWWTEDDPVTLSTQEDPITNPVIDLTDGCDYTVSASAAGYVTIDNTAKTITPVNSTPAGEFITLTATVDNDYYYGQITKQIAVTNLKSQTIDWNQSFTNLKVGDEPITLTATAKTSITYQSSNTSVITVSGNQMTIVGKGSAYVVATAAADAEYAQEMAQKAVIVRNPGESCAPYETTSGDFRSGHDLIMQWDFPATSVSYTITKPTNVGLLREATIQELYDNSWHTIETFAPSNQGTSHTKSINIKSRAIRVTSDADNNMTVNSLRVDMTQYLNLSPSSLSMTATTTSSSVNNFSIDYSNIQGPLEYTSDNPYISFSPTSGTTGDCGEWGSATINVTYAPAEVQDGDYTITVWDGKTASLKKTITVHCKATAPVQTMTWNQTFGTKLTTDLITFNASTDAVRTDENPYPVVYTTSDASVATVINGNQLNILKSGTVTVTASQDGKDGKGRQRYNAVSIDKAITIEKVTPTVTFPTATTITYGTALSNDLLIGGTASVPGSFAWVEVGQIKSAGKTAYDVIFTPNNVDWYNTITQPVTITINKANQTITWETETNINFDTPSASVLNATTTGDGSIVYTIDGSSDAGVGTITNNVLTLNKGGKLVINANAAATTNFNAATQVQKTFMVGKWGVTITWEDKDESGQVITTHAAGSGDIGNHFVARDEKTKEVVNLPIIITNSDNTSAISIRDNKLYVDCAGTATITAQTATTDQYGAGSGTVILTSQINTPVFTWQIPQPAPNTGYANFFTSSNEETDCILTFTSSDPTLAKVEGGKLIVGGDAQTDTDVTFTVTQTGNCRWEEHTETFTIHIKKPANHVPFTITESNYKDFKTGGSGAFSWDNGMKVGKGGVLDGGVNWDDKTFILHFSGIPDKLSFTYNCTDVSFNVTNAEWFIQESADGQTWSNKNVISSSTSTSEQHLAAPIQLSPTTRYITFCYSGNFAGVFKNINVTELKYFYAALTQTATEHVSNVNMGVYSGLGEFPVKRTIYLRHANAGSDLQITIGDTKNFRLEHNISTGTDQMGDDPITVIYEPDDFGIHNTTLTIHDGQNSDIVISVNAAAQPGATYTFIGTDGDAGKLENWQVGGITPSSLPNAYHTVVVQQPMVISKEMSFYYLDINNQYPNAKVTIAPTGGLTIGQSGIRDASADRLIIQSSIEPGKEGQGYLRISPKYTGAMPQVTAQFATRSTLSTGANKDATWQYFGVPGEGGIDFTVDGITWLYDWQEKMGWVPMTGTNHLEPFHGYVITQYGQPTYNFVGKMTTENQDITLTYTPSGMGGSNIFANSYTAPIEVKNFTDEDFEGDIDKTFYLYNAGSWNQWKSEKDSVSVSSDSRDNTPGTYYAIPALSAKYLDDQQQTTIPSLSGVFVIAHEDGAKIHLNYRKHVWNVGAPVTDSVAMHRPLRAPQRVAGSVEEELFNLPLDTIKVDTTNYAALLSHRVVIRLTSENSGYDRIILLEKTDDSHFTAGYDNGYDAQKIPAEGIANIYTTESEGNMAVSATNKLDGMYLGVLAGEDETYHLRCSSVVGDSLYLLDMVNGVETRIIEGMTYSFNASANSQNDRRFMIMEHEKKEPSIVTANNQIGERDAYIWTDPINLHIENASSNAHVRLYAADGKLIYATNINRTAVIPINDLPNSVYMVQIGDKTNKFIKK